MEGDSLLGLSRHGHTISAFRPITAHPNVTWQRESQAVLIFYSFHDYNTRLFVIYFLSAQTPQFDEDVSFLFSLFLLLCFTVRTPDDTFKRHLSSLIWDLLTSPLLLRTYSDVLQFCCFFFWRLYYFTVNGLFNMKLILNQDLWWCSRISAVDVTL